MFRRFARITFPELKKKKMSLAKFLREKGNRTGVHINRVAFNERKERERVKKIDRERERKKKQQKKGDVS